MTRAHPSETRRTAAAFALAATAAVAAPQAAAQQAWDVRHSVVAPSGAPVRPTVSSEAVPTAPAFSPRVDLRRAYLPDDYLRGPIPYAPPQPVWVGPAGGLPPSSAPGVASRTIARATAFGTIPPQPVGTPASPADDRRALQRSYDAGLRGPLPTAADGTVMLPPAAPAPVYASPTPSPQVLVPPPAAAAPSSGIAAAGGIFRDGQVAAVDADGNVVSSGGAERRGRDRDGDIPPADERHAPPEGPLIQEIRGGVLLHDAGVFGSPKEDGVDINAEVRFRSFRFLEPIGAPRPTFGLTGNTAGDTSMAYAGLNWSFDDIFTEGPFVDLFLGLAVHTGKLELNEEAERRERKELGSRILFREAVEIGWRFADTHSVSIILDHISNANTSSNNEGLDGLGIRYGYRF